jgi:C_GCAxxG_C_C family probable redox protein
MNNENNAEEVFYNGFNCAQAVMTTYCSKYNMDDKTAKKLSCGFGGGCARQSLTCGAVSGAFMVIGLKYGKAVKDDSESNIITYSKINEFSSKFRIINNSINCTELLGIDLATIEGQNYFNENNLKKNNCTSYVKDACNILDEMGL